MKKNVLIAMVGIVFLSGVFVDGTAQAQEEVTQEIQVSQDEENLAVPIKGEH
jgi:hypothetical protein